MIPNFHEEFRSERIEPPSERSTGAVFAIVLVATAIFFHNRLVVVGLCLAATCAMVLACWLKPLLLRPLNMTWFRFSMLLYRVVNPIVMLAMYLIAIIPIGLVMQLLRDPLQKKRGRGQRTYWLDRTVNMPSSMKNQF
jgi:hypothetical protein